MRFSRVNGLRGTAWLALAGLALPAGARDLLNASFDISRELFRAVNPAFGGWEAAQRRFFAEGTLFDRIVLTRRLP